MKGSVVVARERGLVEGGARRWAIAVLAAPVFACAMLSMTGCGSSGQAADAGAFTHGPCPAAAPVAGTPCTLVDTDCEYGDDPNFSCRTQATCAEGIWQLYEAPVPGTCPSRLSTTCPATLDVAPGTACDDEGAWCAWPTGGSCVCTSCPPYPPYGACTDRPTWYCGESTANCPLAMPRAGSACTAGDPQSLCNYGCWYGTRRCMDGMWRSDFPSYGLCPQSRRATKQDIHYLSRDELDRLAADTESMRLASYRYRSPVYGPPGQHLGFIIDDNPNLPAISATGQTVDLYGFASMLLATSQAQARRIEALEQEVARLKHDHVQRRANRKAPRSGGDP